MSNDFIKYTDKLLDHYESFFGTEYKGYPCNEYQINTKNADFCVAEFPSNEQRDFYVYTTLGMSSEKDANPIELCLFSIAQNSRNVEILMDIALQHRTTPIEVNSTFKFCTSWTEKSKCNSGLVMLPYFEGPFFEECDNISCLWLVPITEDERKFKEENGIEALEQQFADNELNYLHYLRDSVV